MKKKTFKGIALASLLTISSLLGVGCGGKTNTDGKTTDVSSFYQYTFFCKGGDVVEGHENRVDLTKMKIGEKRSILRLKDLYIDLGLGDYMPVYSNDSSSWSGTIKTGNTIVVKNVYIRAGSSKTVFDGKLKIEKIDTVKDGNYTGKASFTKSK